MNKKFDYAVYIGRFQPFHQGHLASVREGLKQAENIIILIGSVNQPRSQKNPWLYQERRRMIRSCFSREDNKRILIAGVRDYPDDNAWAVEVKTKVKSFSKSKSPSFALIGFMRDDSSYYLKHFPEWSLIEIEEYQDISATRIRCRMIKSGDIQSVTRSVADRLRHFLSSKTFTAIANSNTITCPEA